VAKEDEQKYVIANLAGKRMQSLFCFFVGFFFWRHDSSSFPCKWGIFFLAFWN
jgi:hypothetical protein